MLFVILDNEDELALDIWMVPMWWLSIKIDALGKEVAESRDRKVKLILSSLYLH